MLSGEATYTNFIVFGLTRSGLEPTIYHTQDEHDNYSTSDVVDVHVCSRCFNITINIKKSLNQEILKFQSLDTKP